MCELPPLPPLPGVIIVASLAVRRQHPLPSSSSLNGMDYSIKHPSTLILDLFDCLTSRRFIAFQIALDTTCELDFLVLFFAPLSPSPAPSLVLSLGPSFSPPLTLHSSISISHSDSRVCQDGQHTYSHAQYTSVDPTLFSRSQVITHQSAIPSHPIIHIHIHMFIPLHRHRAYTSLI